MSEYTYINIYTYKNNMKLIKLNASLEKEEDSM